MKAALPQRVPAISDVDYAVVGEMRIRLAYRRQLTQTGLEIASSPSAWTMRT